MLGLDVRHQSIELLLALMVVSALFSGPRFPAISGRRKHGRRSLHPSPVRVEVVVVVSTVVWTGIAC